MEAINQAFDEVVAHLRIQRDMYIKDLQDSPENFEGFTKDDAYIWFVESF